eukprot:jgi/Mesen1/832/ME000111S10977
MAPREWLRLSIGAPQASRCSSPPASRCCCDKWRSGGACCCWSRRTSRASWKWIKTRASTC